MKSSILTPILLLGLAAIPLAGTGCGDDAACPRDVPADVDGGDGEVSPEATDGGDEGDGPCVPLTCSEIDAACGTVDNGCGEPIVCWDDCSCSPTNYATACPSRACMTVSGCSDEGECVYAPVVCGSACTCALGACDDSTPRSCGDGLCTAQYCLPSPVTDGTTTTYGNQCVSAVEATCGTCDLGRVACDAGAGTLACEDMDLASDVNPAMVECDSTVTASTFVFMDPAWTGTDPDGSREKPFPTLFDALSSAATRGAKGVIIGGAPVFLERPEFVEGISVYGGFTGFPLWRRDPTLVPSWRIPYEGPVEGLFVGVWIREFAAPTVLADLAFTTTSLSGTETEAGVSNYGMYVADSPGLRLHRVRVTAGGANRGGDGAVGEAAPVSSDGYSGQSSGAWQDAATACPGGEHTVCESTRTGGADACMCEFNDLTRTCTWGMADPPRSCHLCPGAAASEVTAGGKGGRSLVGVWVYLEGTALRYLVIPNGAVGWPSPTFWAASPDSRWDYYSLNFPPPGTSGPSAPSTPSFQGAAGSVAQVADERAGFVAFHVASAGRGGDGSPGLPGVGGGGGTGGWGYHRLFDDFIVGGGGGGGGAGGCGGGGGTGGWPGGYSVALFVVRSAGMVVRDCTFNAGAGGDGGEGGQGGAPARGGMGGAGGGPDASVMTDYSLANCSWAWDDLDRICLINGSAGGSGGTGQPGGYGGNGAGGSSIGAYCHDGGMVLEGNNTFNGGAPGAGGTAWAAPGPSGFSSSQRGCAAECGNGVADSGEPCDDGNLLDHDGCNADCTLPCATGSGADRAVRDPTSGQCLAAYFTPLEWTGAEAACTSAGGTLAAILDATKARAAAVMLASATRFHIGLTDGAVEGTFTWLSGDPVSFTDWCPGEPAGGISNNCTVYRNDLLCWAAVPCTDLAPYVCQFP